MSRTSSCPQHTVLRMLTGLAAGTVVSGQVPCRGLCSPGHTLGEVDGRTMLRLHQGGDLLPVPCSRLGSRLIIAGHLQARPWCDCQGGKAPDSLTRRQSMCTSPAAAFAVHTLHKRKARAPEQLADLRAVLNGCHLPGSPWRPGGCWPAQRPRQRSRPWPEPSAACDLRRCSRTGAAARPSPAGPATARLQAAACHSMPGVTSCQTPFLRHCSEWHGRCAPRSVSTRFRISG